MSTAVNHESEMIYRCATTCVECGATGDAESAAGVMHKTILCDGCKTKLRAGRARLTLTLTRPDSDDTVNFELGGFDLWLVAMVPSISMFVEVAVRSFQTDRVAEAVIGGELSQALEAILTGQGYVGKFVTVVRDGAKTAECATVDSAMDPGQ